MSYPIDCRSAVNYRSSLGFMHRSLYQHVNTYYMENFSIQKISCRINVKKFGLNFLWRKALHMVVLIAVRPTFYIRVIVCVRYIITCTTPLKHCFSRGALARLFRNTLTITRRFTVWKISRYKTFYLTYSRKRKSN